MKWTVKKSTVSGGRGERKWRDRHGRKEEFVRICVPLCYPVEERKRYLPSRDRVEERKRYLQALSSSSLSSSSLFG